MDKKLDDFLVKKYPKIFIERKLSKKESCMGRGFECEDGWFQLINNLCEMLQFETDNNKIKQVIAKQVKEKFGGLRFYSNVQDKFQQGLISFAEEMSFYICESCGTNENIGRTSGYILTLCEDCARKKRVFQDWEEINEDN